MKTSSFTIDVAKKLLIEMLTANMETHKRMFAKGDASYRIAVVNELNRRITEIKAGRKISNHIHLERPTNHTEDYCKAIRMLNLHNGDTVAITKQEFSEFVEDDWRWKSRFLSECKSKTSNLNDDDEFDDDEEY